MALFHALGCNETGTLQDARASPDTDRVRTRPSTLDLIAAEFATSVAAGHLVKAEGWLATAALVARRERDRPSRQGVTGRFRKLSARQATPA